MTSNKLNLLPYCFIFAFWFCFDFGAAQNTVNGTTSDPNSQPETAGGVKKLPEQLLWSLNNYRPLSSRAKLFGTLNAATISEMPNVIENEAVLHSGKTLSRIWALAQNFKSELIYYTDYVTNYFGIYNMRTGATKKVFQGLSFGLDGVAVDWISGNVYWSDTDLNRIFVATSNFTYFTDIVEIKSRVPAKIAINPLKNLLIWTERRLHSCKIYKSDLSGNNITLLHNLTNTESIDDLTLDPNENRLYWTERVKKSPLGISQVKWIDVDNTSVIHHVFSWRFSFLTGIASLRNYLYISNYRQKTIFAFDKQNRTTTILRSYLADRPRNLIVFSGFNQRTSIDNHEAHPCYQHTCQQICIPTSWNERQCACAIGYHLATDKRSCRAQIIEDNFVLLADSPHSKIYQLSLTDSNRLSALPLQNIGNVLSADFDTTKRRIYWSDTDRKVIASSFLNGSGYEVHLSNIKARSIAIEQNSRNLYAINSVANAIIMLSLDLPNISTTLQLLDIYNAWGLLVSSRQRKVFWSDLGQVNENGSSIGYVESMNLDGSGRKVIAKNTFAPAGLAIDESTSTLFWAELWSSSIVWKNLKTSERGKLHIHFMSKNIFTELSGLAFYNNDLYITDTRLSSVQRLETNVLFSQKSSNFTNVTEYGPTLFYTLSEIRIISMNNSSPVNLTACGTNRSNCPEMCVPSPSGMPKCLCQSHSNYTKTNNTCTQVYDPNDNIPPSFGDTCPQRFHILSTEECLNTAQLNFSMPTATDNSGYVTVKRRSKKPPPYTLTRGIYTYSYKAVDRQHNLATCVIYVLVYDAPKCNKALRPVLRGQFGNATCTNRFGSRVPIFCNGNRTKPTFYFRCRLGEWTPMNGAEPICPLPPNTTTTLPATEATVVQTTNLTAVVARKVATSGGNPGVVVAVVIVVLVILVLVVFFVFRRGRKPWSSIRFFRATGDDQVQLTGKFNDSPKHGFPAL